MSSIAIMLKGGARASWLARRALHQTAVTFGPIQDRIENKLNDSLKVS